MDKNGAIWLFGRKVKVVKNNSDYSCNECALKDICEENLIGINEYICSTGDGSVQKFLKAE